MAATARRLYFKKSSVRLRVVPTTGALLEEAGPPRGSASAPPKFNFPRLLEAMAMLRPRK
jgi:hypothetical protein